MVSFQGGRRSTCWLAALTHREGFVRELLLAMCLLQPPSLGTRLNIDVHGIVHSRLSSLWVVIHNLLEVHVFHL